MVIRLDGDNLELAATTAYLGGRGRADTRTAGVRDGLPLLEDGRALEVANVVWCTGFRPGFPWIDLPVFEDDGEPRHDRGVVASAPGLYVVGRFFQTAVASSLLGWVGNVAGQIAARAPAANPPVTVQGR